MERATTPFVYRRGPRKTPDSPTLLWDLQQPVPLADWGLNDKEAFETAFQDVVTSRPDELHGLVATSGDSQGKFSTLTNFLKANTGPKTAIGRLAERENRVIRIFHFEWGAPFFLIPEEFRSRGVPYHDDPEARAVKQREVNMNEQLLAERLYALQQFRQDNFVSGTTIDLFFGDIVADSGFEHQGKSAGIVRGHTLLRDITHGTGQFSNAALGDVFYLPVYTPYFLRHHIRDLRAATAQASTIEQKKAIYAERGITIESQSDDDAAMYLQNEAPSNEWDLLDRDEAEVIARSAELGHLPMPHTFPPNMVDERYVVAATDLKVPAMSQHASPFILREVLEIPQDRVLFSSNSTEIDGITIHLDMMRQNVMDLDKLREDLRRPVLPHSQT